MIRPSATHINDEKESDGTEEQRKQVTFIFDLTKREKRAKSKYWREDNRKRAERVAITAQVEANEATALNATPPTTPPYHLAIYQNAGIQQAPCGSGDRGSASRQETRGARIKRRTKSASYRKIVALSAKLENFEKKMPMYRKRLQR